MNAADPQPVTDHGFYRIGNHKMGFAPGQTIADIQTAAYPAGDSYYAGAVVTVSGVITALPPDVEDRTDPEPWPPGP